MKVGDKVRCVKPDAGGAMKQGEIYEISEVACVGYFGDLINVVGVPKPAAGGWYPWRFAELYVPTLPSPEHARAVSVATVELRERILYLERLVATTTEENAQLKSRLATQAVVLDHARKDFSRVRDHVRREQVSVETKLGELEAVVEQLRNRDVNRARIHDEQAAIIRNQRKHFAEQRALLEEQVAEGGRQLALAKGDAPFRMYSSMQRERDEARAELNRTKDTVAAGERHMASLAADLKRTQGAVDLLQKALGLLKPGRGS